MHFVYVCIYFVQAPAAYEQEFSRYSTPCARIRIVACAFFKAIATECGIFDPGYGFALEGPDFRKMTPAQLDEMLPRLQVCVCDARAA